MTANAMNTEKLVTDLKRVVRDSEDLLKSTTDTVGEKTCAVRERLAEALAAAKRSCGQFEEKAIAGAKVADKAVREHPYQSMGVALGIGLLIGVLVTRK